MKSCCLLFLNINVLCGHEIVIMNILFDHVTSHHVAISYRLPKQNVQQLKTLLFGGLKGREYMYTYGWFMLRFDRKQQNSVKQLSFS